MTTEQARVISVTCEGPYAIEVEFADAADPNNQVIKNYDDEGKLLTVDCPWLVSGMCHNLWVRGMVKEHQDLKGTLACTHLRPATKVS